MSDIPDHNPELLKNMPSIRCPELYADDNDVYFSQFNFKESCSPLEDEETLRELLERVEKLNAVIQRLMTMENVIAFNVIVGDLHHKMNEQQTGSWWDLDPETLSANALLFLTCYPFFDRWGGSWEVRFALTGMLGKYISQYKRKLKSEEDEEPWPDPKPPQIKR